MRAAGGLDSGVSPLLRVGMPSSVSRETSAQRAGLSATAARAELGAAPEASAAVRIERLVVRKDRVHATVRVASFARMTTSQLAARVARKFPLIERHACVNEQGNTFGLVIAHTPLPHLMEHLVIALQAQAELQSVQRTCFAPSSTPLSPSEPEASMSACRPSSDLLPAIEDFTYVGTSEWMNEAAGEACIEVNFTDDLVALRAFRDAADFLNAVVVP